MIIFLRKIPANTRPTELHDYVAQALKGRPGQVLKAEILTIQDKRTNVLEYHGLVFVDSEITGLRAIKNLQATQFNNTPVAAREYKHRFWGNDRRHNGDQASKAMIERRKQDRRRGNKVEIIIDMSNVFGGPIDSSR